MLKCRVRPCRMEASRKQLLLILHINISWSEQRYSWVIFPLREAAELMSTANHYKIMSNLHIIARNRILICTFCVHVLARLIHCSGLKPGNNRMRFSHWDNLVRKILWFQSIWCYRLLLTMSVILKRMKTEGTRTTADKKMYTVRWPSKWAAATTVLCDTSPGSFVCFW